MDLGTAKNLFEAALAECKSPVAVADGRCPALQVFERTIPCSGSDAEVGAWIRETVEDFAGFERELVGFFLRVYPNFTRRQLRLVRRLPPSIARVREPVFGDPTWRIAARCGVTTEPVTADPRFNIEYA